MKWQYVKISKMQIYIANMDPSILVLICMVTIVWQGSKTSFDRRPGQRAAFDSKVV